MASEADKPQGKGQAEVAVQGAAVGPQLVVYSRAFEKIVGDNSTVADNLLAYALYKLAINEKYRVGGKHPPELRDPPPGEVAAYLASARRMLDAYATTIVDARREEMRTEVYADHFESLSKDLETVAEAVETAGQQIVDEVESSSDSVKNHVSSQTRFWPAVVTNLVAWLISIIVVLFLALTFDFVDLAARLRNLATPAISQTGASVSAPPPSVNKD